MKHKIVILTGQSGCGKDTIANKLTRNGFKRVITNTTRPPRDNEVNGKDYYFISENNFLSLVNDGSMIEYRKYNTVFGTWYYGSSANNIDLKKHDYVIILTLDGVDAFINYFGAENCIIFYIDCPTSIREKRAENRPNFDKSEWNRRVLTDKEDFSNDKVAHYCNFKVANYDRPLHDVVKEILIDVKLWKNG